MKSKIEIEEILGKLKPFLFHEYSVERIGYFGSFSRNEQKGESDIDILVSFGEPLGWEFFDLRDLLERELELKVDLVSEKALKSQLRPIILSNVKYV